MQDIQRNPPSLFSCALEILLLATFWYAAYIPADAVVAFTPHQEIVADVPKQLPQAHLSKQDP